MKILEDPFGSRVFVLSECFVRTDIDAAAQTATLSALQSVPPYHGNIRHDLSPRGLFCLVLSQASILGSRWLGWEH